MPFFEPSPEPNMGDNTAAPEQTTAPANASPSNAITDVVHNLSVRVEELSAKVDQSETDRKVQVAGLNEKLAQAKREIAVLKNKVSTQASYARQLDEELDDNWHRIDGLEDGLVDRVWTILMFAWTILRQI